MATAYENLIRHLKSIFKEYCVDEDELYDLLHSIQSLELEMKEMLHHSSSRQGLTILGTDIHA